MITAVIECRGKAPALASTLAALVPGAVEGVLRDVLVITDSCDVETRHVADSAGCRIAIGGMSEALRSARGDWLLLLEPGARPLAGWLEAVETHMDRGQHAARFRAAGGVAGWFRRVTEGRRPLRRGILIRREAAMAQAEKVQSLDDLARGGRTVTMDCLLATAEGR